MADRTPNTRLEKWMAKIAGETVDITPKDRLETLLAKIAGESVSITPDDTLEYWLNQIAENGGGGGGSSDFSTATVTLNLTIPTGVSNEGTYVKSVFYDDDFDYTGEIVANANTSAVILLYKGIAGITGVEVVGSDVQSYIISDLSAAVLSGNIAYDSDSGAFLVTGDCSITAIVEPGGK